MSSLPATTPSLARVDYAAHDAIYQRLRLQGAEGWDDDAEYARMLGQVAPLIAQRHDGPACILELGCGAGNLAFKLAALGHSVCGTDISPVAVAWANEKARALGSGDQVQFMVDNVVVLSKVTDARVDVVVDSHCLHCIVGADRAGCLRAVHRVLRPGGAFIVMTMCGDPQAHVPGTNFDPASRILWRDGSPIRHIGRPAEILHELMDAGLRVDHWHVEPRRSEREFDDLVVVAIRNA